jgi:hypothetical protein
MRSAGPAGPGSGRTKNLISSARASNAVQSFGTISVTDRISLWCRTPWGVNQPDMPQRIPPVTVVVSPLRMALIISRMWQGAGG